MPPRELTFARLMVADLIAAPLAAVFGSIILFLAVAGFDPPGSGLGGLIFGLIFFTLFASVIAGLVIFVVLLALAIPLTLALQRTGMSAWSRDGALMMAALVIGTLGLLAFVLAGSSSGDGAFVAGWFVFGYSLSSAFFWVLAVRMLSRPERAPYRVEDRFR